MNKNENRTIFRDIAAAMFRSLATSAKTVDGHDDLSPYIFGDPMEENIDIYTDIDGTFDLVAAAEKLINHLKKSGLLNDL